MTTDDLEPEEEGESPTNNVPLVAAGLLLLAGIATIVLFMIASGRFPKSWVMVTSLVEIGAAILLLAMRSSFAGWVVIAVALALGGYHAYDGWEVWRASDRPLPIFGHSRMRDPDLQTRAALARMSQAEGIHLASDAAAAVLDLTVFVLLVGTRKGRVLLSAE